MTDRLIIPKKPQHHKHRLLAALAICGLMIVGVWGLQMKMTFAKYQADRDAQGSDDTLDQTKARLQADGNAAQIQASVAALRAAVEDLTRKQVAKDQVLDQVSTDMTAQVEAGTPAPTETTPPPTN